MYQVYKQQRNKIETDEDKFLQKEGKSVLVIDVLGDKLKLFEWLINRKKFPKEEICISFTTLSNIKRSHLGWTERQSSDIQQICNKSYHYNYIIIFCTNRIMLRQTSFSEIYKVSALSFGQRCVPLNGSEIAWRKQVLDATLTEPGWTYQSPLYNGFHEEWELHYLLFFVVELCYL